MPTILTNLWTCLMPSRIASEIAESEAAVALKRRRDERMTAIRDARADAVVDRLDDEHRRNHFGPMLMRALKGDD